MKIHFILFIIQYVLSIKCGESYFLNEKGECQWCITGYYCPGDNLKYECPDGYFSKRGYTECDKCGCDNCLKGYIVNETTRSFIEYAGSCSEENECYPGYGYEKATKVCELCKPGSYSKGGKEECKRCKRNTIQPKSGQTFCEICPPNQGPFDKHTRCDYCQKGTYYDSIAEHCMRCPMESITTEIGQTECIKCGENSHSNRENTECIPGPRIVENKPCHKIRHGTMQACETYPTVERDNNVFKYFKFDDE